MRPWLTASALTVRMHRLEFALVALAIIGLALVGLVVPGRLGSVGVPEDCFRHEGATGCRSLLETFYAIRANEASWLLGIGAGLFPVLVGLILGAPVVAREIELRTAGLAWSLTGHRGRWLAHRLLAPAVLIIVGLGVLGGLATALLQASEPGGVVPRLDQLGSQGITFVARGVMAFGLAVLIGAVTGRTMASFLLAGILTVVVATLGYQGMYAVYAQQLSSWHPDQGPWLIQLRERYFWPDGRPVTSEDIDVITGREPDADAWIEVNLRREVLGIPGSDLGGLEGAETIASLTIGLVAVLVTFPVVGRRRAW